MLSCKQIVRILSSDEQLPLMKKAELKMHLMMCRRCSRYSKHLQMISNGFKKLFQLKTRVDSSEVERFEKQIVEVIARKKLE